MLSKSLENDHLVSLMDINPDLYLLELNEKNNLALEGINAEVEFHPVENSATIVSIILETKLSASDGSTDDRFGAQLDLDNNTILVGARADDDNGDSSGSAYIFERVNGVWKETKLLPSDGARDDIFGDVLAIAGNIAVIGALGDDDLALNSGAAYIFELIDGVWTETTKLTPSDGMAGDRFGKPAIDENRIFIGSDRDDAVAENAGAAYVFERNQSGNWNEVAKLTADDAMPGDRFGRYIDLDGDRAIVGALYGDGNTVNSGAAYIFEYQQGQWRQTAKLFPSDGEPDQLFGRVVKISGNTAVVGSFADNQEQGAAYIFERVGGEWQQTAKLTASDGEPGDRYGASVAIDDGIIVIASRQDDDQGESSGSAYGYEKIDGVWTEIFKLLPSDGMAEDVFGKRIELNNNTLIVGAPFDDERVPNSGSVYIYQLDRAGNRWREARRIGAVNIDSVPKTVSDWVGPGDEFDFYRFYLPEPSEISVNLDGLSANANLFLGDRRGQLLVSSRQPGSESELIITTLEAGSYTVMVRGLRPTNYNLSLSAQFAPQDVVVSDLSEDLFDPEFDQINYQVTWQDKHGDLWVAPVNSQTGNLILAEKVFLDSGLAPLTITSNGPEWVYSQDGSQIVYTKLLGEETVIGQAYWDGSEWKAEILPDTIGGRSPTGSLDPEEEFPLVRYVVGDLGDPLQANIWRQLNIQDDPDAPIIGGTIPELNGEVGVGGRWIPGERSLVLPYLVDNIYQVFQYDIDTETLTQITSDPIAKRFGSFMWRAPEFDNDLVLMVPEKIHFNLIKPTQLGIYRNLEGQWTKINTIEFPLQGEQPAQIHSPEPFVYNGRSYLSLLTINNSVQEEADGSLAAIDPTFGFSREVSRSDLQGAKVWVVAIDPAVDFSREVSDGRDIIRNDPEPFITETGAFVYYTETTPDRNHIIRLADTGLGLPEGQITQEAVIVTDEDTQSTVNILAKDSEVNKNTLFSLDTPPDGAGNRIRDAYSVGILDATSIPQIFLDWVGEDDQRDFYRFELQASLTLELALGRLSANANLFLLDASGNIISSSTNEDTASEFITLSLEPDTYFILVRSDHSDGNPATDYQLNLSTFVVDDVLLSDNPLPDPEFDPFNNRVTWQDTQNRLWVAPIDSETADILLDEKELLDTNLAPLGKTQNGPEWIHSQNGSAIVYTKLDNDGAFVISSAQWTGSEWELAAILPEDRNKRSPYGSLNPQDDAPLISYFLQEDPEGKVMGLGWRELYNPDVRGELPELNGSLPGVGHWVQGERSLTTHYRVNGIAQAFKFDVDSEMLTQLTFSETNKTDVWMWQAPEFGDELVFLAIERDGISRNKVGVYRKIGEEWTQIKAIQPPSDLPFIFSPEPFVYNGRSLVSFFVGDKGDVFNLDLSEAWIAGIDPEFDFYRKVNDQSSLQVQDPEPFVNDTGAFIFYSRVVEPLGILFPHRADAGLEPPDGAGNSFQDANDIGFLDNAPIPYLFTEWVSITDEQDFYRFQLQASSQVEINLDGLSNNVDLLLYDSTGTVIADSLNQGDVSELINETLNSGTYYVLVKSSAEYGKVSTTYELTMLANYVPNDVIVQPLNIDVIDPEYSEENFTVAWQSSDNKLNVTSIDPETGDILWEENEVVDDILPFRLAKGNAAEIAYSSTRGTHYLYHKFVGEDYHIAEAYKENGNWVTESIILEHPSRNPFGSKVPSWDSPIATMILEPPEQRSRRGWVDLENPEVWGYFPSYNGRYPTSGVPIESNLDDPPKLVGLNYRVNGWSQVFLYNIDLDELEQVTFDETNKSNGAVFWTSEEYNNELTMVIASSPNPEYRRGTKISFYRLIEDSWTEVNTFRPPTNLPYLHSVEPFDFDGISYVSYFTTDAQEFGLQENGEMWISRVDGSFHRKISAPEYENNHEIIDPESFETEDTVFIYYTEMLENGNRIIHRADTGLKTTDGAGNSLPDAYALGLLDATPIPQIFTDWVGFTDKKDFYRFQLQASSQVEINLDGLSNNVDLFLYDSTGTVIADSLNQGDVSELINETLNSGTYYVLVKSSAEYGKVSTTYELTMLANYVPNDVIIQSLDLDVIDSEYSEENFTVAWQSSDNKLNVTPIDPETGDILWEENEVVDSILPFWRTSNGPEIAYSSTRETHYLYHKFVGDDYHIAQAYKENDNWVTESIILDHPSRNPHGSKVPSGDSPIVTMILEPQDREFPRRGWIDLENPEVWGYFPLYEGREPLVAIPIYDSNLDDPPKVVGLNYKVDGWSQIFLYNIDSDELEQVTFDETNKSYRPVFWTSEEYNHDLTMAITHSPNPEHKRGTKISFYRLIQDSWTEVNTFRPPTNLPYLHLVQPFDFDGISYVTYATTDTQEYGLQENGEVWISRVDGSFHRKISAPEYENNHEIINPEAFKTEDTVFIYYTEVLENGNRITHRADTGLGLPDGQITQEDIIISDEDRQSAFNILAKDDPVNKNTLTINNNEIINQDFKNPASFDLLELDGTNSFVISNLNAGENSSATHYPSAIDALSSLGDINNDVIMGVSGIDPNGLNLAGENYVV